MMALKYNIKIFWMNLSKSRLIQKNLDPNISIYSATKNLEETEMNHFKLTIKEKNYI